MANPYKQKGDRLENLVCMYLSTWVSGSPDTKYFIKAPDSGAVATKEQDKVQFFSTVLNKPELKEHLLDNLRERNDFVVADIFPVHPKVYPFSRLYAVECKNYRTVDWGRLLFQPHTESSQSTVYTHWSHLVGLCNTYKRVPLLVYNETRIKTAKGARRKHPVILVPDDLVRIFPSHRIVEEFKVAHFPQLGVEVYRIHDFLRCLSFNEMTNEKLVQTYLHNKQFTVFPILNKKKEEYTDIDENTDCGQLQLPV